MAVKFIKGIEIIYFTKQGYAISKDTISTLSWPSWVLLPDSTDIRPMLLLWLHIIYWTIQNALKLRCAQIITNLTMPPYPTQP